MAEITKVGTTGSLIEINLKEWRVTVLFVTGLYNRIPQLKS